MFLLLILWLALLVALIVFAVGRPGQGGALVLSYFLGLSLIHVPGILPYLAGAYLPGLDESERGFRITVIGMATFVAGAVLAKWVLKGRPIQQKGDPAAFEATGLRVLLFGAFSYFILLPASARVASLTSAISPLGTLLIVGIWMRLYAAAASENTKKIWQTLVLLPILPLSTLSSAGYLGYGIYWLISILAFYFTIERRRMAFYFAAPIVAVLGLSFFTAYMGERSNIRDVVWSGNAGIGDRVSQVSGIFTNFHFLDLNNRSDTTALQDRLNQNLFVGLGSERIDQGVVELYYGKTVPVWAVVPRAIWPDKPDVVGGAAEVAEFTGQKFGEDTTVGMGQVLEFYMNFGLWGVLLGFGGFGFLLMWIDLRIVRAFRESNVGSLLKFAAPGLTLMQPGGNLTEMLIAVVAAIAVTYLISLTKVFEPKPKRRSAFPPMQPLPVAQPRPKSEAP